MSVWYCIPSKRPPEEVEPVLKQWRERGYKIALLVDWNPPGAPLHSRTVCGDLMLCGGGKFEPTFDPQTRVKYTPAQNRIYFPNFNEYPGYAQSVNALIIEAMKRDPDADWCVTGGDDVLPDPNKSAEEIARECSEYFTLLNARNALAEYAEKLTEAREPQYKYGPTFGVMQPTGDRWGLDPNAADPVMRSAYIDRVCGSPWMGREFCRRINQGNGPLWPGYFHMGADEELQAVATKLGILWQRPDLNHHHQHWGRPRAGEKMGQTDRMPAFLKRANSGEEWYKYKALFAERQAAGFPGSEPL